MIYTAIQDDNKQSYRNNKEFESYFFSSNGQNEFSRLRDKNDIEKLWNDVLYNKWDWNKNYHQRAVKMLLNIAHIRKGLTLCNASRFLFEVEDDWSLDLVSNIFSLGGINQGNGTINEDADGNTLLHEAAPTLNISPKWIKQMHDIMPDAAWHENNNHELPFLAALATMAEGYADDRDVDCIEMFLKCNSTLARVKLFDNESKEHVLPLHYCIFLLIGDDPCFMKVVQLLYEAYPLALSKRIYEKNKDNNNSHSQYEYVLHQKCHLIYIDRQIIFLLEKYPEGLFQTDSNGLTPFHILGNELSKEESYYDVKGLINKIEQSSTVMTNFSTLQDKNTNDNLLHILCKRTFTNNPKATKNLNLNAVKQMFHWIVETFPHLVNEKNNNNELPVHVLLSNNGDTYNHYTELVSLVNIYDTYCIDQNITNELLDLDYRYCSRLFRNNNGNIECRHPLFMAASQTKSNLSTIYFFAKRHIAKHGSFSFPKI